MKESEGEGVVEVVVEDGEGRVAANWLAGADAGVCRCVLVVRNNDDNGSGDGGGGHGGVEGSCGEVQSAEL